MNKCMTLEAIGNEFKKSESNHKHRIIICAGTGCVANGAQKVFEKFKELAKLHNITYDIAMEKEENAEMGIAMSGCQGFCQQGPLVTIYPMGILYVKVTEDDVEEIVEKSILKNEKVERLFYTLPKDGSRIGEEKKIPFYARQQRLLLELCGHVDACCIEEYIYHEGYKMARKAATQMEEKEICEEISASGLRGRGGGGFPTGLKWDFARKNESDIKYVICNADEGDPGAFMDRCLMEGNPHSVIEGMIIAAMAVGAEVGYVYVRMEYPLAVQRFHIALEAAREIGVLGDDIFGSGKRFDIIVVEGAGAFVCGEETALIASVEGKRGMPTIKPPFPAEKGLYGKPTVINNVETLAAVPLIMRMGSEKYASMGTETAKGTKTFALTGHVANTGLIEVPFGITLREIVDEIGGGVINDDGVLVGGPYKAVQIGGPSGGCLTIDHSELPLDYDNLQKVGAMVGSGGIVVMNQDTCMVKIARYFMQFTQNESCGKCVVCREGTRHMLLLLDDIIEGNGTAETIDLLEDLANVVKVGSLCALGKTAPNPVLSSFRYFREEVEAHVFEKRCPAGQCEALLDFYIIPEKCKCCNLCAKKCPVDCISGVPGKNGVPYVIDTEKCIKCGVCVDVCKFDAVIKGKGE